MLYELRIYDTLPGRLPALHKRFREHTVNFFAKYGIEIVGFWEEAVGQNNRLVYMLAFDDMADRERKWTAFQKDPDWARVRAESEKDGPINNLVTNRFLLPTDYSPLK